jgi:3-hydroxybutyryl-CoA dehydrogenase
MEIRNVYIQGAGIMGSGIAQVVAQAGFNVTLNDTSEDLLEKAIRSIEKSLQKAVDKGKLTQDQKEGTLKKIEMTVESTAARTCDLVVEAVFEDLQVKRKVFEELDKVCPQHTILATNTSSLPVSAIASATKRPHKVVGVHFMNPVPLIRGVEIIKAIETSDETFQTVKDFVHHIGKEPVEAVDYAGFVVSRILDAMLNEAVRCVMDGNKPEEIDKAMKICTNFPMGPLELIDLAGADIVLHGLETMERDLGDHFHPSPLLRQMVRAGHLGRKTGKGFYKYKD